jgi:hypothetical protein
MLVCVCLCVVREGIGGHVDEADVRCARTFSLFCRFLRAAASVRPVQSSSRFSKLASLGMCCRCP